MLKACGRLSTLRERQVGKEDGGVMDVLMTDWIGET